MYYRTIQKIVLEPEEAKSAESSLAGGENVKSGLTQQGSVVQDPIGALRNSAQKLILGHLQLERAVTWRWA